MPRPTLSDIMRAQGTAPPVSDELEGSPRYSAEADADRTEREATRAQARGLADAMTGSGPDAPQPQPRDTLLTRLLHAQGLLGPGAMASPPQQSAAPAQPPVVVNVGTPDAVSGAGPIAPRPTASSVSQASPAGTATPPPPTPPVSDELEGAPAYADGSRLADVLRAQGRVPTQPASPPAQAPAAPAEPGEIEMFGDDRDGPTAAPPDSVPQPPLPSVRDRAASPAQVPEPREPAAGVEGQPPGTPSIWDRSRWPGARGPAMTPPAGTDAAAGTAPITQGASTQGTTATPPPDANRSPHAMGFKRTLTAAERSDLERDLADPKADPDDREAIQMQLDLDESRWAPVKAPPPGMTPYVEDGRTVPNVYVGTDGETQVVTGDPDRDSRIRGFSDRSDRERQLAHRPYEEKQVDPYGRLSREETSRLTDVPEGTRWTDPGDIEANTRRYIAQNEPRLPGGFSDNLGGMDSQGRPVPPTDDDVAYRQGNLLDQGYRDSVESLARQRAVEEARQRQELPLRRGYDETSARISQQRIDALQEFVRSHRRYWDMARQAQQAADAKYPNPDDLLGGKGSWTRTVALAIRAVGPSIGMAGTAALVDNQLRLEYAGRQAAYNREAARAEGAAMNAGISLESFKANDAALVGQLAAAKERLADQFELIGAGTADQAIQAKYQALASRLKEDAAKSLGAFATQLANRDLKNAHLGLTAAQIEERRREFDIRHGAGGGSGTTPEGYFLSEQLESLPKDKRERAVLIPGTRYAVLAQNTQLANEANKQLAGTRQTIDHIDAVLAMLPNMPGWFDKVRAKARLEPGDVMVIRNELQQAALSAKEAYKLGAISKSDADMLESLGADPGNVSKLNVTADKLQSVLTNWRAGMSRDAQNTVTQFNTGKRQRVDFGSAPEPVRPQPAAVYLERLKEVPVIDASGAWMPDPRTGKADHSRPFMSRDDIIGTIDSAVEALDRDGVPWVSTDPNAVSAKEAMVQSSANMFAAWTKARGQLNMMVQERTRLIRSGRASGRDREAAIDRVESSVKALDSGVKHIDDIITRRSDEQRGRERLDKTKTERMLMRLPH